MRTVKVPVIETDKDLQEALKSLELVFMAEAGTPEADLRDALALVIESYERKRFSIEAPDCISAIRFAMEQRNYSTADVAKVLGGPSRLSEIMHGKRTPSLNQIRALHSQLGIPLESLMSGPVKPYAVPVKQRHLAVHENREAPKKKAPRKPKG